MSEVLEPTDGNRSRQASVRRLREEIDRLTRQQVEACESATYLGMTQDWTEQYDARRQEIMKLLRRLLETRELDQ